MCSSANPDAFARAAFGRDLRVVGLRFEFDDSHDAVDGQIGLGRSCYCCLVFRNNELRPFLPPSSHAVRTSSWIR